MIKKKNGFIKWFKENAGVIPPLVGAALLIGSLPFIFYHVFIYQNKYYPPFIRNDEVMLFDHCRQVEGVSKKIKCNAVAKNLVLNGVDTCIINMTNPKDPVVERCYKIVEVYNNGKTSI